MSYISGDKDTKLKLSKEINCCFFAKIQRNKLPFFVKIQRNKLPFFVKIQRNKLPFFVKIQRNNDFASYFFTQHGGGLQIFIFFFPLPISSNRSRVVCSTLFSFSCH